VFESVEVAEEGVRDCSDALAASVRDERLAAATKLARVARWADMHPPEPGSAHAQGLGAATRYRTVVHGLDDEQEIRHVRRWVSGRSRYVGVQVGADGTPMVSEFAVVELGVLLETTTGAAQVLLRDVLDLRHRLPLVWKAVMTGQVEAWQARKAACVTRPLSFDQARLVDTEVLEALTGLPYGRAVEVIEGRVIAADPAAHEARRQAEAERRYVSLGRRPSPEGLRMLYAQTTAGDLTRLDAIVEQIARLLADNGDTDPRQVRRAKALGILADPAGACLLMAGLSANADQKVTPHEHVDQHVDQDAVARALAWAEALRSLGAKVVDRLRPRTVLYLHLGEEGRVARSNLGPLSLAQLLEWLGRDRVIVKPVIDLTDQASVDAYEVPKPMAEHVGLREPFEVFPWGTQLSRGTDSDHTVPYVPPDEGGPPGQTHPGNLGPLGRRHHNAKTHGGFVCHQPLPGMYLWQLPCGLWYQVDHTGTHALGRETPEILRQRHRTRHTRVELAWSDIIVAA
jgi:hypothetical protein